MKKVAIVISMCLASAVYSAESDWTPVTGNDTSVFSIKNGSVEISKNDGGETIVLGTGRISHKSTTKTVVEMWYVKLSTCARQLGKLFTADTDGKIKGTNEFAFGQGSVASRIGEILCYVATEQANKSPTDSVLPAEKGNKKNI